jgi:hypothetical protein
MHYIQRRMQFDLVVWIGDMDDSVRRELYRPARLTVDDVAFLVIEPPDDGAGLALKGGPIRIDAGQGRLNKARAVFRMCRPKCKLRRCPSRS